MPIGAPRRTPDRSITPGKYADLVVLDRDILTVAEEEIPGTQVDMTVVAGEVRFRR